MIQYNCAKCGSAVAADNAKAGQPDTCPNCGNVNIVPQAAAGEPQAESPQGPTASAEPARAPGPEGPPAGGQAAPTPPPQAPPPGALSDRDARMWGMFCHLAALAGYVIPFGNIAGPFVIWMIQKDKSPFVEDQGKEALNFQITMGIAGIVSLILIPLFGLGVLLLLAVGVVDLVFIIIAAMKANEGQAYRYPFAIRFIK